MTYVSMQTQGVLKASEDLRVLTSPDLFVFATQQGVTMIRSED